MPTAWGRLNNCASDCSQNANRKPIVRNENSRMFRMRFVHFVGECFSIATMIAMVKIAIATPTSKWFSMIDDSTICRNSNMVISYPERHDPKQNQSASLLLRVPCVIQHPIRLVGKLGLLGRRDR
jgi:hypothetical protein